jgi:putative membrane protein
MSPTRLAAVAVITAVVALAHTGEPLERHDLWTAWRFEPGAVIPLVVSAVLYACGARAHRGVTRKAMLLFWSGWVTLTLALVSPLHPLGEALFSAHMAQHEILMLCAAPLMVLSRPLVPMLWGLPFETRRLAGGWSKTVWVQGVWRAVSAPFAAWWIHAIALWVWHAPSLFQATLRNEWVHAAQHSSFFLSAILFWWSLFYVGGRAGYGAAVIYVFTTAAHTSILGALLTFATVAWYPAYGTSVSAWGLTPLEDQQIGGLIMWVPAGLVYLAAGLVLMMEWMKESDQYFLQGTPGK